MIAWTYKKLILLTPSPSPTTPPQTKLPSLQTQLPLPTLHYKMVEGGRKGRSALLQTYSDPPKNMRKAVSLARLRYKRTHQPWSTWHDIIHHKSSLLNHSWVFVLIIFIKSGQVFFCVLFIHSIIMPRMAYMHAPSTCLTGQVCVAWRMANAWRTACVTLHSYRARLHGLRLACDLTLCDR